MVVVGWGGGGGGWSTAERKEIEKPGSSEQATAPIRSASSDPAGLYVRFGGEGDGGRQEAGRGGEDGFSSPGAASFQIAK